MAYILLVTMATYDFGQSSSVSGRLIFKLSLRMINSTGQTRLGHGFCSTVPGTDQQTATNLVLPLLPMHYVA